MSQVFVVDCANGTAAVALVDSLVGRATPSPAITRRRDVVVMLDGRDERRLILIEVPRLGAPTSPSVRTLMANARDMLVVVVARAALARGASSEWRVAQRRRPRTLALVLVDDERSAGDARPIGAAEMSVLDATGEWRALAFDVQCAVAVHDAHAARAFWRRLLVTDHFLAQRRRRR